MAEKWELSDDGTVLTLHIREGVTWHDGEPFTAKDVKFNIDEMFALQVYGAQLAERIESTEIVDDSTVVVTLTGPYGPLMETLGTQFILPRHLYEGTDYITNPANKEGIVGTGPMKYLSYSPGQEVVLERNADYWGGDVQVDRAVFTQIPDPNSRAEALFSGEIDEAILDPSQQGRVTRAENMQLLTAGFFPEVQTMMYNARNEHLADPEVRAAIFAAIDRDALVDVALSGVGLPTNGFFPDAFEWAINPDVDFAQDFPRDLDAINEALDDAGFPVGADGKRFSLRLEYIASSTDTGAMVELIISMLAEVGIEGVMTGNSGAIFTQKVYTDNAFDLAFLRTSLGAEPSLGVTRWYACNESNASAANPSGVCDPELEAAANAALTSIDRDERAAAYRDLQERAEEVMISAPLVWSIAGYPTVNSTRWQGLDEADALYNRKPWLTMTPTP